MGGSATPYCWRSSPRAGSGPKSSTTTIPTSRHPTAGAPSWFADAAGRRRPRGLRFSTANTASSPGAASLSHAHVAHPSSTDTIDQFARYVIPNYRRFPVSLVRGEGSWVWDAEGHRYLDFFPGWGCNLLGHCPPRVVAAVRDQVGRLIHVPNTWYMEPQGAFAQALSERSF